MSGVVFDAGAGPQAAADGPGIPGVAVSDGHAVAVTDAQGRFSLEADASAIVFVVKPRGWCPPVDAQNLPQFYARPPHLAGRSVRFPLLRHSETGGFRVLVLTDPQPSNPTEVGYVARTIGDELGDRTGAAFAVVLGDVTYDRHDLYPSINDALAPLKLPLYCIPGNHDLDYTAPSDRAAFASFEAVYGPSTYAFWEGEVLFLALGDVRFLGGPRYAGGLRPDQFEFIERMLALAPREARVVVMAHIPFFAADMGLPAVFRDADRRRLFALLANHPHVLALTGHTHYQRHVFHDAADGWTGAEPLHEYNVAAVCGGFWGGRRDADGIPMATMWDGTPAGYGLADFDAGGGVRLRYVPGRLPADDQISLHAPAAIAPKQGYVSFYANVFDGHSGWNVEARVDGRGWLPMRMTLGWDPEYASSFLAQDAGPGPGPVPRLPDPTICYHLWRAYLPADLGLGPHELTVRATSPDGAVYTAAQPFKVSFP